MSTCQCCGLCCRKLIIEIGCHDVVREPRLAEVSQRLLGTGDGPCEFNDECEASHSYPCRTLAIGEACPMLGTDNRCTIYPTRPNVCVVFPAGGKQCRELREAYLQKGRDE
jgi:Fe-S-cluster containining protein